MAIQYKGQWVVESLHGIATIKDDRGLIVEDGLSPHHARRIVLEHNIVAQYFREQLEEMRANAN